MRRDDEYFGTLPAQLKALHVRRDQSGMVFWDDTSVHPPKPLALAWYCGFS